MAATGQLHALTTLPPGKDTLVPFEQEVRWTPESIGMLWKKDVSYCCQQSYHNSSVFQLVSQSLTMISSSYTKHVQIKMRTAFCALLAENLQIDEI
jgi:hypothetical protein